MYAIQLIMDILSVVPAVDSELELKISLSLFLWKIIRVLQNLDVKASRTASFAEQRGGRPVDDCRRNAAGLHRHVQLAF